MGLAGCAGQALLRARVFRAASWGSRALFRAKQRAVPPLQAWKPLKTFCFDTLLVRTVTSNFLCCRGCAMVLRQWQTLSAELCQVRNLYIICSKDVILRL